MARRERRPYATKTVYVRYLDRAGNVSRSFPNSIALDTAGPVVGAITAAPNPFAPQLGQTTTIRIPVSDQLLGFVAAPDQDP